MLIFYLSKITFIWLYCLAYDFCNLKIFKIKIILLQTFEGSVSQCFVKFNLIIKYFTMTSFLPCKILDLTT